MSKCVFCGHETDADVSHYQGSVSSVCKSTLENRVNCKSDWQNFKIRLAKYKVSKFPQVQTFAYLVEKKVMIENEPALEWNRQLISIRKIAKHLPLIPQIKS